MTTPTLLHMHIHQRDLAELVDIPTSAGRIFVFITGDIAGTLKTTDSEASVRELSQRVPHHGDALMIIEQQLGQKSIEKGIQPGRQDVQKANVKHH